MYDPKFEKEVQQKMEGLEFSPSEAVWANIEQAVNADKKRRRLPFFWMLFLSGMLLLGAGIVYMTSRSFITSRSSGAVAKATVAKATGAKATGAEVVAGAPATTGSGTPASVASGISPTTGATVTGTTVFSSTTGTDKKNDKKNRESTYVGNTAAKKKEIALKVGRKVSPGTGDRYGAIMTETAATTTKEGATTSVTNSLPASPKGRHSDHIQGLISFRLPAPRISGARLPVQKTSGLTNLSTPKRPWEAAFTGGVGISSFKQMTGNQSGSLVYASPAFSYFTAPGTTAYSATISKGGPSTIEAGPAFYAGILARKPLSARWAATIGLDLSYNSSRIHTGPIVNGYTPASYSLINAAAAAPIQTYPYYVAGDDQVFTNRYYSLEIPATVQWQLNHSRRLPLFLESGLSFSYLVSSDALYYNSNSDVYFKDRDVVNRAQVNFTSSLMVGLPLGGVNLQAGPQVEYGLTTLLKTSAATGQHLFYGGLRVVIIPKGKK